MRWGLTLRIASIAKQPAIQSPRIYCRAQSTQSPKPHYTTTPIFYVNGAPHIGHLHSVVLADVFSRWAEWRNKGWSVPPKDYDTAQQIEPVLATGTDEHGIKIQKAAESQGISPRELCDRFSDIFRGLPEAACARKHRFIRTTDESHIKAVEHVWDQLEQRGFIYKSTHEGWYAVSDEAFYTASQVIPSSKDSTVMVSAETGSVVEWSSEVTYKFKLSKFQQPILDWLEANPDAIVPASRRDDLVDELKKGLSDLSISRPKSRLQWGITVPSDKEHVIYVWLDALTNYLTVAGYPWKDSEGTGCWPSDVQIIGKDIIRFHAIYFPAMLMALELPLPKHLVVHGHWTVDKMKMSKSKGNVIDPQGALASHSVDEIRWFLCRLGGNLGTDSDWSPSTLEEYHKKYLAGQWGNHLSRVMGPKMLSLLPSDENKVTLSKPESNEEDKSMVEALEQLASKFDEHTSKFEVNRALETISDVLAQSNYHFQTLAPWQEKATVRHRQRAMYYAYETCRIAALLSQSILPRKMQTMLDILQVKIMDRKWSDALKLQDSISITSGAKIEPIFPNFVNSDDNDEGILRPDNGKLRRHAHKHKKRAKYGMIN